MKQLLTILAGVLLSSPAFAQVSGGSFGGGSFSGGGGGYSGGGGGYSGGSWSSGGSYGGGGSMSLEGLVVLIVFMVIIHFVSHAFQRNAQAHMRDDEPSWDRIDVSALMLAIDWRSRRFVQEALMRMAQRGDTQTPAGLAALARETALVLRRAETAWLYAGIINSAPSDPSSAEALFRRIANDARSRFRHELIRSHEGVTQRKDAPGTRVKAEEGEGIVVVTFLVAAKRALLDIHDIRDANAIRQLLQQVIALDAWGLAAMEVIWSPAEETDRMSSAELEVLYPELRRIAEHTMAGRVFCGYCGGPFAGELPKCPHCGAPHTPPSPQGTSATSP